MIYLLPDYVPAVLGIMNQEAPIKAVLELDVEEQVTDSTRN